MALTTASYDTPGRQYLLDNLIRATEEIERMGTEDKLPN